MSAPISPRIVDALLLGQGDRRRQLQAFPILVDVWTLFAQYPASPHDLLITPLRGVSASLVGTHLDQVMRREEKHDELDRGIAQLQGLVAVRVRLRELWTMVLPATSWWASLKFELAGPSGLDMPHDLEDSISSLLEVEQDYEARPAVRDAAMPQRRADAKAVSRSSAERQLIRLGLLIGCLIEAERFEEEDLNSLTAIADRLGSENIARSGAEALRNCWNAYISDLVLAKLQDRSVRSLIYNVSANRQAEYAVSRSVPAIKADAARQLFSISCAGLGWAVLDSGIDRDHPAFAKAGGGSRVAATFDFSDIRAILSRTNLYNARARQRLASRLSQEANGTVEDIEKRILALAQDAERDHPINWSLAEPLIRRDRPSVPDHPHGTHVAGILGGNWEAAPGGMPVLGVCRT
jgi:hypothetical protein